MLDEAGVRPAGGADDDRHALTIALAGYWWPMPRLRRSDCAIAGIKRRRRGRGFEYIDESGERIEDPDVIERIRALAIPPGWEDVWICADPLGHIQATGLDARSRKQYRYHDLWRERRDRQKFESMLDFGTGATEASRSSRAGSPQAAHLPRASARLRRAAARPWLLPDRIGGLRRGERDLRPRDDAKAPRDRRREAKSCSTMRRRGASGGCR